MSTHIDISIQDLLKQQEAPCISLYQPTHRTFPDNKRDPILFKNLLKKIDESLRSKYPGRDVDARIARFRELAEDSMFWRESLSGLAVFQASDGLYVFRLQRPVPQLFVVADSFHTKPLIRILQSADRYQVLALTRTSVRLFEGNRDDLDEVRLAEGVPATIADALGEELTDPHQTVASYGMGSSGSPMRHGHGGRKDEVEIDTERFFRAVDRAILEHHSRPTGLPLMLCALPEYHSMFRRISHNSFLMEHGIDGDPGALTLDQLRDRSWNVREALYLERLNALVEQYGESASKGLATDDLAIAAQHAVEGRIATLLIDADRHIPGKMNRVTGEVVPDDLADPDVDDMLDDLGEVVLKFRGEVVVVPSKRMPTQTGLAAMYRF